MSRYARPLKQAQNPQEIQRKGLEDSSAQSHKPAAWRVAPLTEAWRRVRNPSGRGSTRTAGRWHGVNLSTEKRARATLKLLAVFASAVGCEKHETGQYGVSWNFRVIHRRAGARLLTMKNTSRPLSQNPLCQALSNAYEPDPRQLAFDFSDAGSTATERVDRIITRFSMARRTEQPSKHRGDSATCGLIPFRQLR